jgi:hypothetical protein
MCKFNKTASRFQDDERGPRSFPWEVKEACWRKAEKVPGRSPDRWRMDPYGNMVFKKLVACEGALCHNYDHVQPFSKVDPFAVSPPPVCLALIVSPPSNRDEMVEQLSLKRSVWCSVGTSGRGGGHVLFEKLNWACGTETHCTLSWSR